MWKSRDPLKIHRSALIEKDIITEDDADKIVAETADCVAEALQFARSSAYPDPSTAYEDMFHTPVPAGR